MVKSSAQAAGHAWRPLPPVFPQCPPVVVRGQNYQVFPQSVPPVFSQGGDGMNYVSPVLLARPAVAGEAVGRIMLTRIIN